MVCSESCWWWLRSPGNNSNNAANVNNNGNVNANGNNVNNNNNAVRPALSDQPEAKSMRTSLRTDKGTGFPPEAGRSLCRWHGDRPADGKYMAAEGDTPMLIVPFEGTASARGGCLLLPFRYDQASETETCLCVDIVRMSGFRKG